MYIRNMENIQLIFSFILPAISKLHISRNLYSFKKQKVSHTSQSTNVMTDGKKINSTKEFNDIRKTIKNMNTLMDEILNKHMKIG